VGAHVHSRHRHRGGYLVGAKHQELARHALVLVVLIDNHAARGPWKVARFLPLLLTPVLLLASTFPGEYRVPAAYWVLAVAECLLYPLAERWPFAVSVAISALALPIFVIEAWGPSELLRYLGAVALVEVIVRCNRASGALATACWAAVVVVGMWNSQTQHFVVPPRLVDAATLVVLRYPRNPTNRKTRNPRNPTTRRRSRSQQDGRIMLCGPIKRSTAEDQARRKQHGPDTSARNEQWPGVSVGSSAMS
jgi:hypothetical protein